jgi:GrpB-like predicted nucleotidyltransferase (UPF0157 family)
MILIEPYSDRWPGQFEEIAARLRALLRDRAVRIDHIGSTAVSGLAAKSVIDVQVAVRHLGDARPLVEAGVEEIAVAGDHRPPGVGGPDADWEKRLFSIRGAISANVHVRVDGRANQRYALLFRDYLRAHSDAAGAYEELKRRLARELSDRVAYTLVKDPACDLIAIAADAWAAETGWQPGPSDG